MQYLKMTDQNAGLEKAGPENDGPNWILVNLNISGNSPCWSEVGQQILKESFELFKFYRDLKKSKMSAPYGRHLGFWQI
jgi:hypothetical protein